MFSFYIPFRSVVEKYIHQQEFPYRDEITQRLLSYSTLGLIIDIRGDIVTFAFVNPTQYTFKSLPRSAVTGALTDILTKYINSQAFNDPHNHNRIKALVDFVARLPRRTEGVLGFSFRKDVPDPIFLHPQSTSDAIMEITNAILEDHGESRISWPGDRYNSQWRSVEENQLPYKEDMFEDLVSTITDDEDTMEEGQYESTFEDYKDRMHWVMSNLGLRGEIRGQMKKAKRIDFSLSSYGYELTLTLPDGSTQQSAHSLPPGHSTRR